MNLIVMQDEIFVSLYISKVWAFDFVFFMIAVIVLIV